MSMRPAPVDGKFSCSLRRLELSDRGAAALHPDAAIGEYHASYDCQEVATQFFAVVRVHHKRFRLGFYPSDQVILFMHETGERQ